MNFFNNHRQLFATAALLFLSLTYFVAINPAFKNQENNAPLPSMTDLTEDEMAGKKVFIANGCVACHTQQVRNIDMDKVFGKRPSIASDYALNKRMNIWQNTATLMGTERTGPDLTDIGNRQPSAEWNLLHLYNPRAVVAESIMPAYLWLFNEKSTLDAGEKEIAVPEKFRKNNKHVVASSEALQLIAYLQSLKQAELPDGTMPNKFLYEKAKRENSDAKANGQLPDGEKLYVANCQSCHQANGEGLKGAFPALKGSPIVLGDDLELYVNIIMKGYDARPEYASMPAVGLNNKLTAEEVTALINHERSSWGNTGKPVAKEEVSKIMGFINKTSQK